MFYCTNETGDKVGCVGRWGENPRVSLAPFFPSPCPFCCAGLDGVSVARAGTNALPSWANTSRPSFLLAWLHPPLGTFIPVQGYLSTDSSLLGNLPMGVYLQSRVHLPLGAFSLVSPVFSFHYVNSTCLHISLTRTRFGVCRCTIFPFDILVLSFFFLLGFRFRRKL